MQSNDKEACVFYQVFDSDIEHGPLSDLNLVMDDFLPNKILKWCDDLVETDSRVAQTLLDLLLTLYLFDPRLL